MRVRLDVIDSYLLRPTISSIHKKIQTNQVLNHFHYLNDQLLFSVDGTKYFQSNNVSCPHCNIKTKRNGQIEYSHQALVCSLVNPDKKQVFPFFHEDIHKKEGETKNDCEQNAAKRFLPEIRKVYPHQKITILEGSALRVLQQIVFHREDI